MCIDLGNSDLERPSAFHLPNQLVPKQGVHESLEAFGLDCTKAGLSQNVKQARPFQLLLTWRTTEYGLSTAKDASQIDFNAGTVGI